jgi:glycosyltransferase involved in cell wall biosynthesis
MTETNTLKRPWLSVLIPVYNVEAYLMDCVQSVLCQATNDIEVLLLDDVGTDSSPTIMHSLAQTHPNTIKLLAHTRNRGLSAARNTLLANARGEYVWFLDSDDVLFNGAINSLKQTIQAHSPDLILCDFGYLYEQKRLSHRLRNTGHRRTCLLDSSLPSTDTEKLIKGLLICGELHAWSKIARRDVWQCAPFPEARFFEDIPTIAALVRACKSYVHVRVPWVGYRQRDGSILSNYNAVKLQDLLQSLLELKQGTQSLKTDRGIDSDTATEDFCMRALASGARHISRLSSQQEKHALLARYQAALPVLFPNGAHKVFARWMKSGWWIRLFRIRARLKSAGII